jgi:fructose-1-phosphate kinase PfkB-like protein
MILTVTLNPAADRVESLALATSVTSERSGVPC